MSRRTEIQKQLSRYFAAKGKLADASTRSMIDLFRLVAGETTARPHGLSREDKWVFLDEYAKSLEPQNKPSKELYRRQRKVRRAQPGVDFYASEEWRRLRFKVLKTANGVCMLCGRGRPHGVVLHVDHIKPRSKHPELELIFENLQVLCEDCNLGKGNRDDTDWR